MLQEIDYGPSTECKMKKDPYIVPRLRYEIRELKSENKKLKRFLAKLIRKVFNV